MKELLKRLESRSISTFLLGLLTIAIVTACASSQPDHTPLRKTYVVTPSPTLEETTVSSTTIPHSTEQGQTNDLLTTITLLGDVSVGRKVNVTAHQDNDFNLFDDDPNFEALLSASNLVVANLESIIAPNCGLTSNGMTLCGSPEFADQFTQYPFVLSTANNHSHDFPEGNGYESTQQILTENKVPFYNSYDPEHTFYSTEINGITIGFLGFDFATNGHYDSLRDETASIIQEYDPAVDFLILSVHWGGEYQTTPSSSQINFANAFTLAGADLVVGTHPHVVQTENGQIPSYVNSKPVFYSLGNTTFDQTLPGTTESTIFQLTLDKNADIISIQGYDITIAEDGSPHLVGESVIR